MSSLRTLPLPVRWAVIAWVGLLAGVLGRVTFSPARSQTVVPVYRTAGERWLAGDDLYAPAPPLDVYRYPPGVAAGFAPWAVLPEKPAGLLWRTLGAGVFVLGLRAFLRDTSTDPLTPSRRGWAWLLAVPLVLLSLNNGQVNLLLAGGLLHGAAAAARGRWWAAALWLAVGAWVKVYPLAAGVLVALLAPGRLGWRLGLATAAGFAAPFLLQDPGYVLGQYRRFVEFLGLDDRTYSYAPVRWPRDWTIVPRVWLGWVPPPPLAKGVAAAAGLLSAGLVRVAGWWADPRTAVALAAGFGAVWMTLFGPATELSTYALLAGVAPWLVVRSFGWRRVLAAAGYALLVLPVLRGMFPKVNEVYPFATAPAVGAAVLFGLLAEAAVRPRRSAGRPGAAQ